MIKYILALLLLSCSVFGSVSIIDGNEDLPYTHSRSVDAWDTIYVSNGVSSTGIGITLSGTMDSVVILGDTTNGILDTIYFNTGNSNSIAGLYIDGTSSADWLSHIYIRGIAFVLNASDTEVYNCDGVYINRYAHDIYIDNCYDSVYGFGNGAEGTGVNGLQIGGAGYLGYVCNSWDGDNCIDSTYNSTAPDYYAGQSAYNILIDSSRLVNGCTAFERRDFFQSLGVSAYNTVSEKMYSDTSLFSLRITNSTIKSNHAGIRYSDRFGGRMHFPRVELENVDVFVDGRNDWYSYPEQSPVESTMHSNDNAYAFIPSRAGYGGYARNCRFYADTNYDGGRGILFEGVNRRFQGTNEMQRIQANQTMTTGSYTITFDGQTTSPIAYNASSATIEATIEALSNVTNVTIQGYVADSMYFVQFNEFSYNGYGGDSIYYCNIPAVTIGSNTTGATISVFEYFQGAIKLPPLSNPQYFEIDACTLFTHEGRSHHYGDNIPNWGLRARYGNGYIKIFDSYIHTTGDMDTISTPAYGFNVNALAISLDSSFDYSHIQIYDNTIIAESNEALTQCVAVQLNGSGHNTIADTSFKFYGNTVISSQDLLWIANESYRTPSLLLNNNIFRFDDSTYTPSFMTVGALTSYLTTMRDNSYEGMNVDTASYDDITLATGFARAVLVQKTITVQIIDSLSQPLQNAYILVDNGLTTPVQIDSLITDVNGYADIIVNILYDSIGTGADTTNADYNDYYFDAYYSAINIDSAITVLPITDTLVMTIGTEAVVNPPRKGRYKQIHVRSSKI